MKFLSKSFRHVHYWLQKKAVVLSYHRITRMDIDPWELAVSPENFEQHLQILKKYNLVTPDQLSKHLKNGTLKNKMVCVTFDDGYHDNYRLAKPLLEKYKSPATIFIPVHFIGQSKLFWWDELQAILLGKHHLPQRLSISIANDKLEFDLNDDAQFNEVHYRKNTSWIWYEEIKTKRAELYLEIWKRLKPLQYAEIDEIMERLRQWCSCNMVFDNDSLPMNDNELKNIIIHPLFSIGIHTVTHPALAFHTRQVQFTEISNCKKQLEDLASHPINTIAYPYGIYNDDTIDIANQLGLESGFTTQGNAVLSKDHPLKLARVHVKNWDGEEFERKLNLWINGF
jgi:peptidoglycan/xylan/chitin deacetylase (PgdA/CDA1 family)